MVNNSTDSTIANRTITSEQKWEENNCMDIPSDKLTKSHMKRPGYGYERETLREKLNLC